MSVFIKTAEQLNNLSIIQQEVLVAFSGGKDSLVVLDLASKYFKRIVCFFMYLVDDLEINNKQLEYAQNNYKIELIKIPHWCYFKFKKNGIYCIPKDTPEIKLKEIYNYVRDETKIDYILTGAKKTDSIWRRQFIKNLGEDFKTVLNPIWDWHLYDVLAYLKSKNIPLPESHNLIMSGVDLTANSLKFLYDNYPGDFKKIEKEFPFVQAAIKRKEWFFNDSI